MVKDRLNNMESGRAREYAQFFKTIPDISSGPDDLLVSKPNRICIILFSSNLKSIKSSLEKSTSIE